MKVRAHGKARNTRCRCGSGLKTKRCCAKPMPYELPTLEAAMVKSWANVPHLHTARRETPDG